MTMPLWNDALTILTFVLTIVLVYYRILGLRRNIGKPVIKGIEDPIYQENSGNKLSGYKQYIRFSLTLDIANVGREPVYIMDISGEIDDIGADIHFTNTPTSTGRTFERIKLDEVEPKSVRLVGIDRDYDLYENMSTIDMKIHLDTSQGKLEKTITFKSPDTNKKVNSDWVR